VACWPRRIARESVRNAVGPMSARVQFGTEMGPKFKSNLFAQQAGPQKSLMDII
jgi:hypothetical protein